MKRMIEFLKSVNPLGITASIGGILFGVGGIVHFATTAPEVLMFVGGVFVFVSGILAASSPR